MILFSLWYIRIHKRIHSCFVNSVAFTATRILKWVVLISLLFSEVFLWVKLMLNLLIQYIFVRSHNKFKKLKLYYHKTYNHQTWQCGDLGWVAFTFQVTCPFEHLVTWYNVTKPLCIHFHKIYMHQTWHIGDLGRGTPTYWVTSTFDHVATWYHVTK